MASLKKMANPELATMKAYAASHARQSKSIFAGKAIAIRFVTTPFFVSPSYRVLALGRFKNELSRKRNH